MVESKERTKETKGEGRWTEDEHQRFLKAYELHGKNWKLIQQCVGTRSAAQSRSHAQKYFRRLNRAKNSENTKEITPSCSPLSKATTEEEVKDKDVKTKRGTKRTLCYNEEPLKKQNEELIIEEAGVVQEEAKLVNEHETLLDIEPILMSHTPLLMNLQYDQHMYSGWEKELDIDNFKRRIASYRINEEPNQSKEEESTENYTELKAFCRSRTLSTIFD